MILNLYLTLKVTLLEINSSPAVAERLLIKMAEVGTMQLVRHIYEHAEQTQPTMQTHIRTYGHEGTEACTPSHLNDKCLTWQSIIALTIDVRFPVSGRARTRYQVSPNPIQNPNTIRNSTRSLF